MPSNRAAWLIAALTLAPAALASAAAPELPIAKGGLPHEVIQRIVARARPSTLRRCYEEALRDRPDLQGRVTVRFTIVGDGSVRHARVVASEIPDRKVGLCVARAIGKLTFPKPIRGSVTVTYPILFVPGD